MKKVFKVEWFTSMYYVCDKIKDYLIKWDIDRRRWADYTITLTITRRKK